LDLGQQAYRALDWSGKDNGEKTECKQCIEDIPDSNEFMLVNIYDITERKKNIKAYANWQNDIEGAHARFNSEEGDEMNNAINKKIEILEDYQRTDVDNQPKDKKQLPVLLLVALLNPDRNEVIGDRDEKEKK